MNVGIGEYYHFIYTRTRKTNKFKKMQKIILTLCTFLLTSCNYSQNTESRKKAIELSNSTLEMIKYCPTPENKDDTMTYYKAISMLDTAIMLDSTFYMSYGNKYMCLKRLGLKNDAIQVMKKIIRIRPRYAEGYFLIGATYEQLENMDSANYYYAKGIEAYTSRISSYKKNDKKEIPDKMSRAFLIFLLDTNKGSKEIESLLNEYPNDELVKISKQEMFDNFNRKEFISNK